MAKPKFQISISEPCPQDLTAAPRQAKGRFCASCQKCVIDFTDKTDREILAIFRENQGKVCGTFRNDQLNRLLLPPVNQPFPRWKAVLFALAAIFAARPIAEAGFKKEHRFSGFGSFTRHAGPVVKPLEFTGRILNKATGQPIANVSITLAATADTLTRTDATGNFRFVLPAAALARNAVGILFYHNDFVGLQLNFTPESERTGLLLEFEPVVREPEPVYIESTNLLNQMQLHQTSGPAMIVPNINLEILSHQPGTFKPIIPKPKKKK